MMARIRLKALPHLWAAGCLTALGILIGLLILFLGSMAYIKLPSSQLLHSYFQNPLLLALNLLPPVALMWMFYLLFGRVWAGYLGGAVPCLMVAIVNYYKISLRGDPLLGADLLLAGEAAGIVGGYTLEYTTTVQAVLICAAAGFFFVLLLVPAKLKCKPLRLVGTLVCIAGIAGGFASLYTSSDIYAKTKNDALINPWSDVEVSLSRGVLYPFLYSVKDMMPHPPSGYSREQAARLFSDYPDEDIPVQQQVNVVGIMLEAFCDLTDFPALAAQDSVQEVYAPWHALEEQGVHGNLLTNIFAGGTVDSEWTFLTGFSQYDSFRSPTQSYVRYLREQGYHTVFHHPGYSWFYNRANVNEYLGFHESLFSEGYFEKYVDPVSAAWNSDDAVVDHLLSEQRSTGGIPTFSFTVTYQNHGPYSPHESTPVRITPLESGWSEESCGILNSYLTGIFKTISSMNRLLTGLEAESAPTVAVLFGDHKPWLGNGESVYQELGISFDFSTLEGFSNYYATPYLIWANSAAKELLDRDFTGKGRDISPCFLMTELFDLCGWEGPGFMQMAREIREISPLLHSRGLFLQDDTLIDILPSPENEIYMDYLRAQYYREKDDTPKTES